MGFGERQQESDVKAVEEECLKPPTNKDPEKAAYNPKQEVWQKLGSRTVPLLYVLIGGAILVILLIIPVALSVRDRQGNANDPARLEKLTGEKPETEVVKGSTAADCLDDWVFYRGTCYYISDQIDTWSNSQNFCKSHNSSLAIIHNEKEMNFLNLLKANKYWIGLSRTQDGSGWVWTDGTSYSETLFPIFRKPTNFGESENVFLNGEGFISEGGKYAKKWICSKSFLGHPPLYTELI